MMQSVLSSCGSVVSIGLHDSPPHLLEVPGAEVLDAEGGDSGGREKSAGRMAQKQQDLLQHKSWVDAANLSVDITSPSTDRWSSFLESEYHMSTTEDHSKLDKLLDLAKLEHKSHNMKICPIYVFLRMQYFKFAFCAMAVFYFYLCCSACLLVANRPTREAVTFSFSALKMRSEGAKLSMLNIAEIGVITDGCERATPMITRTEDAITLTFPNAVRMVGWSYVPGGSNSALDPTVFKVSVAASADGPLEPVSSGRLDVGLRAGPPEEFAWSWADARQEDGRWVMQLRPPLQHLVGLTLMFASCSVGGAVLARKAHQKRLHEGRMALGVLLAVLLLISAAASLLLFAQGHANLSVTWVREVVTCALLLPHVAADRLRLRLNAALFLAAALHLALFLLDVLQASLRLAPHAPPLSPRAFLLSEEPYLCVLGLCMAAFIVRVRHRELSKLKASAQQGRAVQESVWAEMRVSLGARREGVLFDLADIVFRISRGLQYAHANGLRQRVGQHPLALTGAQAEGVRRRSYGGRVASGRRVGSLSHQSGRSGGRRSNTSGRANWSRSSRSAYTSSVGSQRSTWSLWSSASRGAELPATVASLDQLYLQARGCQQLLRRKVRELGARSGGRFFASPPRATRADPEPRLAAWRAPEADAKVVWAGLKPAERAVDKAVMRYGGDVSRLTDVCRETIVFEHIEEIGRCLELIMEDHELEVERVTDHLAWSRARVSEGEAASMCKGVQVKLRFVGQAAGTLGLDGHICELQLVPAALALQLSEQELLRFRNLRDAYTAQARSAQQLEAGCAVGRAGPAGPLPVAADRGGG